MDDNEHQPAYAAHVVVHQVLAAAGVASLVIKGPATARLLYPGEGRWSNDADVLVAPDDVAAAGAALRKAGFRPVEEGFRQQEIATHALTWRPPPGLPPSEVDLHHQVTGMSSPPQRQWQTLWGRRVEARLQGHRVWLCDPTATALLVVLHDVRNGHHGGKSSQDFERALARLSPGEWEAVFSLAEELGALPALTTGLRSDPRGTAVVERLAPHVATDLEWEVRAAAGDSAAVRLVEWRQQPWAARVRLLGGELLPSPAFMRASWPAARRGRLGLLLAHVQRWTGLARRLPRTYRDLRRARSRHRSD